MEENKNFDDNFMDELYAHIDEIVEDVIVDQIESAVSCSVQDAIEDALLECLSRFEFVLPDGTLVSVYYAVYGEDKKPSILCTKWTI